MGVTIFMANPLTPLKKLKLEIYRVNFWPNIKHIDFNLGH